MPAAAAAVSERARRGTQSAASRAGSGLRPLRAGPVLSSPGLEPLGGVGAWSGPGVQVGSESGVRTNTPPEAGTFLSGVSRAIRGGGPAPDSKPGAPQK